jgi:lipopolysaccharide export system protein LptA
MKVIPVLILFLLFPIQAVAQAAPDLTYIGVLVADGVTHVILGDPKSGRLSGFIPVGHSFAGYRIVSCESNLASIRIAKEGREFVLHLVADAKIKTASPEIMIGDTKFHVSADSVSVKGSTIVFLGNVKANAEKGSFTSEKATWDAEAGRMTLTGKASLQLGESRSSAEKMVLITNKAQ